MLILTRRVGETIMIGKDIAITVLGVMGTSVRIGVNAPKEIAVHREEIYERIQRKQGQGKAANDAGRVDQGDREDLLLYDGEKHMESNQW